jgi:hypothetical protein
MSSSASASWAIPRSMRAGVSLTKDSRTMWRFGAAAWNAAPGTNATPRAAA